MSLNLLRAVATIANGGTASTVIDTLGCTKLVLVFGTMTGATVAIKVHDTMSDAGVVLQSAGSDVSIAATDDQATVLPVEIGARYISFVSASAEAAEREITVYGKA